MIGNLFIRNLRDQWKMLSVLSLAVGLFSSLIVFVFDSSRDTELYAEFLAGLPEPIKAFVGLEGVNSLIQVEQFIALGFFHPVWLTLFIAFVIALATGAVSKEIEDGTIEILLSSPVRRRAIILERFAMLLFALFVMMGVSLLGTMGGLAFTGLRSEVEIRSCLFAACNALCLFFCIGGYTFLFSSFFSERGKAMSWGVGVTILFYFLNYIANLWEAVRFLEPYTIFYYYDTQDIFTWRELPVWDVSVLFSVGILCLVGSLIVFEKRDITVT